MTLTHTEIEQRDLIEQYVRRALPAEEAAAVEEHYFNCDQCFESIQIAEKFAAGVRHAGRKGWLDSPRREWLFPMFGLAATAAMLLAIGLGWLWLVRLPDQETKLTAALARGQSDQARIAELDQRAALDRTPEANVPVVILTAERSAGEGNRLTIDNNARTVLLWIDVPSVAGARYRVQVASASFSKSIDGVGRNSNGALAVGLSSTELPDGEYTVRVFRENGGEQPLGEYRLRVARN